RAEKVLAHRDSAHEVEDVSVFPMAMPMLAGPGAIASVMLLMARAEGLEQTVAILGALLVVMVLSLAALVTAAPIMRLFGKEFESVVTRLLGVILAALAAQFVIDGLRGSFDF
ncbi:MAG TPA: MarC family protein, partial [Croceicoccus sp.]|nr:MarC family protein [Croceicoccus sp.]